MISYNEWKNQISEGAAFRNAPASTPASVDIDQLIKSTSNDIAQVVQAYIDKAGAAGQSIAAPTPATKMGPFARAGNRVDDFGRKIGTTASGIGRKIGNATTYDHDAEVPGRRLPGETGRPEKPTRRSRQQSRNDLPNRIWDTLNTQRQGDENKGWVRRIAGRLGAAAKHLFMKKEHIDGVFSEIKSILIEQGIKDFFLTEYNEDTAELNKIIASHLKDFATKLQSASPEVSSPSSNTAAINSPEVKLNQVDAATSPERAAPEPEVSEEIKMAQSAIKQRKKSHLSSYMEKIEAPEGTEEKVLAKLLKSLGFGRGRAQIIKDIVEADGSFPDEVKQAIRKGGLPKPTKPEAQSQPEPEVPSSQPEPEVSPTQPEPELETKPRRRIKMREPEEETQSRELTHQEIKQIKRPPDLIYNKLAMISKLLSSGVSPEEIIKINPHLRHDVADKVRSLKI